jgi:hypothetical protein
LFLYAFPMSLRAERSPTAGVQATVFVAEEIMLDAVALALGVGFFLLAAAYLSLCDRL